MRKNLYLILSILTIILIFSSAATCSFCKLLDSSANTKLSSEEQLEKEIENELAQKQKDSSSSGNNSESNTGSSDTANSGKQSDNKSSGNSNNNPVINGIVLSTLDNSEKPVHSDQEWILGANMTFLLTADATDSDGDAISFKWSSDGGSFDNTGLNKTKWTTPSFPETYHINLEVTDGNGAKASFSKALRVVGGPSGNSGSSPKISDISVYEQIIYCDTTYEVVVTANDPDNDIWIYGFTTNGGTLFNQRENLMDWTTPVDQGTYQINVEVLDSAGNSDSMTKNFDVQLEYTIQDSPTVKIKSITIGSEPIYTNTTYGVYADIYDPGDLVEICIFQTAGGTLSNQSANTIDWTTPSLEATYPFYLTVKDKNGNTLAVENAMFDVVEKK